MTHRRQWTLAAGALALALLAACGDDHDRSPTGDAAGEPADPLAAYRSQHVEWTGCDTSDDRIADAAAALGADALRCTTIRVPADYADPAGGGDLQVGVMKAMGTDRARHLGAILFNPGGPGGDGYAIGASVARLASRADAANPVSARFKEMAARYDMVGFSPRGVGRSTQFECLPVPAGPARDPSHDPFDDAAIALVHQSARVFAEGCLAAPHARVIHTEATARDMDLIRELLGQERLNYVGYSYGTQLGAWYAALFPGRVGKMLLDGALDMNLPRPLFDDAAAPATQHVVDRIIAPWAAAQADTVDVGADVADVQAIYPDAPLWAREALSAALYADLGHPGYADGVVNVLAALRGITAIARAHPGLSDDGWPALVEARVFATDPQRNQAIAQLVGSAVQRRVQETREEIEVIGSEDSAYWAIKCNTSPMPGLQYWTDALRADSSRYPIMGPDRAYQPCEFWGGPAATMPPLTLPGPVMMLHSEFDPLTPLDGALSTFKSLPGASLVLIKGDYQHGLFPYGEDCVDGPMIDYFLGDRAPAPRYTECAGRPRFPSDAAGPQLRSRQAMSVESTETGDPARRLPPGWIAGPR